MKANELRIGNWVMAPVWRGDKDYLTEVESITSWMGGMEINHEFQETGYEWGPSIKEDVKPIPLTEEWLIKFGVKLKYKGCYEPFCDVWWYAEPNGTLIQSGEGIDWAIPLPEFVHEYQNLHFALTGEELTLN